MKVKEFIKLLQNELKFSEEEGDIEIQVHFEKDIPKGNPQNPECDWTTEKYCLDIEDVFLTYEGKKEKIIISLEEE